MTRVRFIPAIAFGALCLAASAQEAAPLPPVSNEVQQLYQSALQSIAEGRKNDAMDALNKVIAQEAQHAGAWLDLALIQCALGRQAEAERLFRHIEEKFDPPQSILELISESRANGCVQWKAMSQKSVSVSRGSSSNVNQGTTASGVDLGLPVDLPTEEFRPRHDQYSALIGDYITEVNANGTLGYVQFQGRRYDRLRQYDTASLVVGIEMPWRFGRWAVRGSGSLAAISLGGHLYQEQAQLQGRVDLPWQLPAGVKVQMAASVNHLRYLTLANFDSTAVELRGQATYRRDGDYAMVSASALHDDATSDRPGGNRQGWTANALWRRSFAAGTSLELAYARQRYKGSQHYSPGLIDITRKQNIHVMRSTFAYPLGRNHALLLEGRVTRNDENISIFQYNDRQLQLSWQWQSN